MRNFITLALVTILSSSSIASHGSCRAAKKCCDGKDTDCEVKLDPSETNIILNFSGESCYCDHGCLDMGDCCHDFKDYCGVYDCEVSEWAEWAQCTAGPVPGACGRGTQERRRLVTRPESNGGVSCPDLHQTRVCHVPCPEPSAIREKSATDVDKPRRLSGRKHKESSALRETAMILPGKFSQISNEVEEADSYDVRQNLKTWHREENTDEYCVVFRVEKAMKACKLNEDTQSLVRGEDICVSCESKSTRPHLGDRCSGHGVESRMTRFKNVITPGCHGKWIKTGVYDKCPCPSGPNFIFV